AVVHLAAIARDAGDRGDAHDVAALVDRGDERLVHREDGEEVDIEDGAPTVRVGVNEQLVPGDPGVVHDDVEATVEALGVLDELRARVRGGDVDLERRATDPVGDLGERAAGGGDVDADDGGAVAGEDLGDGGTDAAGGTGDDGDLVRERSVPAGRLRQLPEGLADVDDLRRDVGRAPGEEEADRRLGVGVRPLGDVNHVRRAPGAHLLADRAHDALEGAAGRGLG